MKLVIVPVTQAQAFEFIDAHHRHHIPPVGTKFCIGVSDELGELRGVATVGRPINRTNDDGWTAEVTRVATDGCENACSALYGAAWRAARAMGYRRMITYTLATEPGSSLRGAGWREVAKVKGRSWWTPTRPRFDKHPTLDKVRWEAS